MLCAAFRSRPWTRPHLAQVKNCPQLIHRLPSRQIRAASKRRFGNLPPRILIAPILGTLTVRWAKVVAWPAQEMPTFGRTSSWALEKPACPLTTKANRPESSYSMIISGSLNSTGCASSNRIWTTVPDLGAGIWLRVFIASTIRSVSPALTAEPTSQNGLAPGSGAR
jgi:hypothetical protein